MLQERGAKNRGLCADVDASRMKASQAMDEDRLNVFSVEERRTVDPHNRHLHIRNSVGGLFEMIGYWGVVARKPN